MLIHRHTPDTDRVIRTFLALIERILAVRKETGSTA